MSGVTYREYRRRVLVPGCSCDVNNRAKASYLLQLMQEMATDHLEELGEGRAVLLEQGYVFLLSKVHLELLQPILSHQVVDLVTRPHQPVGAQFLRDVDFYVDGALAAHGQSAWVLTALKTRRIQRPSAWKSALVQEVTPAKDTPVLQRFPKLELPVERTVQRVVGFSDLDCNQHVNNCVYADMVWDLLPAELTWGRQWRTLFLSYHRENRQGAVLQLSLSHQGELYLVNGDNDQGRSFEARVTFLPAEQ